jgi:hypothetical protein
MLETRLSRSFRALLAAAVLTPLAGCGGGGPSGPVDGHPRLFLTQKDVDRLQTWAEKSNYYTNGLENAAKRFKAGMDGMGQMGENLSVDSNCVTENQFLPCEWFMETFAFMSLVSPDQAERDDYAKRAKKLLMSMMDTALQGPADGAGQIRAKNFSTGDRSRGAGEAFGLTVDWIYPYLDGGDKEKIVKVFLRWADENVNADITTDNHPQPVNVFNDPVLLKDKQAVRFSTNNYFTGHERNLGLMAMALDSGDDPGGKLHAYLDNSTGAFLYMTDYALRNDAKGGLMPEGFEYGPLTMSYVMDLLFALHSAGMDDTGERGPQVAALDNPFWQEAIPAYIHSLAPSLHSLDYPGPYHDYASFGDQETYEPYSGVQNDPILYFGPIALMAREKGDQQTFDTIRWIEENLPPGGPNPDAIVSRSNSVYSPQNAIGYFMLMDPDAAPPADPRPSMPLEYYAPGLRLLFARTGWTQDDSFFTYQLTWTGIDHRHGDANNFGLHRKGEWITKEHTGYGAYESAVHNNLSIENDKPSHDSDLSNKIWQTGSQATYDATGDGQVVAWVVNPGYAYALGDATALYNSDSDKTYDVTHASRSIVWLKPDHVVVYDRAATKTDGRFKRFTLQTPGTPSINGDKAAASTAKGQQLFFTKLLPAGAGITSDTPSIDYNAGGEPMKMRLVVESKDKTARFLNVIQGADAGVAADVATLATSTKGTPFEGAVVKGTLVAFPVDITAAFSGVTIDVPTGTKSFLITGLAPGASYDVQLDPEGPMTHVSVQPGASKKADSGGVLAF